MAQPDFGAACKDQVQERGLSMQSNYLLDYGVSSTCETDVQAVCMTEKVGALALPRKALLSCSTCNLLSTRICISQGSSSSVPNLSRVGERLAKVPRRPLFP